MYSVFIKYCVFSLQFLIFLNSASSAASAGFLPALTEKGQSLEYLNSSEKTQFLMNTLYVFVNSWRYSCCKQSFISFCGHTCQKRIMCWRIWVMALFFLNILSISITNRFPYFVRPLFHHSLVQSHLQDGPFPRTR